MKIDIDYLEMILIKFIESKTQYVETTIFDNLMKEENEKFYFHWDILLDKELILNREGNLGKYYTRTRNNDSIKHTYVRLNEDGYNFYEALIDNNFKNKIKKDFKNISMETLLLVGKRFVENKIDNFLE